MNCIFDIDGTLLDAREIWEKTFLESYQKICGIELTESELRSIFGGPSAEVAWGRILKARNQYSSEKLQEPITGVQETMISRIRSTEMSQYLLPSVPECLEYLANNSVLLACATGNLESIALALLERAGLKQYFPIIACTDPTIEKRSQIVAKALPELPSPGLTYVIGDSPSDIQAAKELGLYSVAVATGHYSLEELSREQPDLLVPNLVHYQKIFPLTVSLR